MWCVGVATVGRLAEKPQPATSCTNISRGKVPHKFQFNGLYNYTHIQLHIVLSLIYAHQHKCNARCDKSVQKTRLVQQDVQCFVSCCFCAFHFTFLRFPFLFFPLCVCVCVFCCVPHSAACLLAEKCRKMPHGVKGAARERAG